MSRRRSKWGWSESLLLLFFLILLIRAILSVLPIIVGLVGLLGVLLVVIGLIGVIPEESGLPRGDVSPQAFERQVASMFERKGYRVSNRRYSSDHGVDLLVWKGNDKAVVQCKRYKGAVSEPVVRDLVGSMVHEGANKGYIITTGRFSQPAREWAQGKNIELIDGNSRWWVVEGELRRRRKPSWVVLGALLSGVSLTYFGGLTGSPSIPAMTPTAQVIVELGDAQERQKESAATPSPTSSPAPVTPFSAPTVTPSVTATSKQPAQSPTPSQTATSSRTPTSTPKATNTVTPSPTILPQSLCPNPDVRLTYPAQDAKLKDVAEMRGSAGIDNFWYYKFEFRAEGGDEWTFLERFDTPLTAGILGYWDTTTLPDGWYDFRLVVVDNTGNYPQPCEVRVLVKH